MVESTNSEQIIYVCGNNKGTERFGHRGLSQLLDWVRWGTVAVDQLEKASVAKTLCFLHCYYGICSKSLPIQPAQHSNEPV